MINLSANQIQPWPPAGIDWYYSDDSCCIACADCREILPILERESVRLVWTDPPYGHCNQSGDLQSARVGVKGARQRAPVAIQNDSPEIMREMVDGALKLIVPLLKGDCCCCCCCGGGPSPTFAWVAQRMDRDGLEFFHAVIWDKTARGPGMGWRFRRDYEMVMVAHKRNGKLAWNNAESATSNIMRCSPVPNTLHPTTKPQGLPESFIRWTTVEGDLVIDPFMGSGTTLRAAKDLGRKSIGIEINERYCEIAKQRLAQEVLPLGS